MMDPKQLGSEFQRSVLRAWEGLTEGWRELLSRSSGALTRFGRGNKTGDGGNLSREFPSWSLLAAECWETALSVIVRIEAPGVSKQDLDVSIRGNTLTIRGDKRSEGEDKGRSYHLMERAYGRFERTVELPAAIDGSRAEVSYDSGVITVVVPKVEPAPPTRLTIR